MDTTENKEVQKVDKPKKRSKLTLLVILACILSAGSLAYSTYSFLDLNKIQALAIEKLGGISLIGLSAALTMDIIWSATMVAEYRGRKVWYRRDGEEPKNILPLIGWIEAMAIAVMLGYHGNEIGGWTAAFTAVLPLATKFTWILAMGDIRDPNALTDEQKEEIAKDRRQARLAKEKSDATAELHEATLEALRRKNEASLEDTRAAIEKKKMEQQATFELKEAELRGANELKLLEQRLRSDLQIATLRSQSEIGLERLDAEQELRLRQPLTIQGHVIRQERGELEQGPGDQVDILAELEPGMKEADRRRAELAARYYAAVAREGSITKAQFCKANNNLNPPRLSEATAAYPVEWFVENGLATWLG